MFDRELPPLRLFDFKIIQEPLDGLLRNMDCDLQRCLKQAELASQQEQHRDLMMLLVMLRFAINSYESVCFLLSDADKHEKRLSRFVAVVPPINRQIMNLWFSLVYIMDDFSVRMTWYELGAYRELREQIDRVRQNSSNPDMQTRLEEMEQLARVSEVSLSVTPEQKLDPKRKIDSWPYPYNMTTKVSKSQHFLKLLDDLIYREISVEAHLNGAGLLSCAGMLLQDIAPYERQKKVAERNLHLFKYRHYWRTVITVLGIVSEIETHCQLNNKDQIVKVWQRMADNNHEAKQIYEARYKSTLG